MRTLDQTLETLRPDENTINQYKSMESKSLIKINAILSGKASTKDMVAVGNLLHKFLTATNKIRTIVKGECSMHIKIFEGISKDKPEFKEYVRVSFPKIVR